MICNGMVVSMMMAAMLLLLMMMMATALHHITLIDIETQSLANNIAKTILLWTFPQDGMTHQKFLSISKCLHDGRKKISNNQKATERERTTMLNTTQIQTHSIHQHDEDDADDDDGNHTQETQYNAEIRNPSFSVTKSK